MAHTISNVKVHPSLAHFPIQLSPTLQTQALFDMGASCPCITQSLFDHLLKDHNVKLKLKQMDLKVGQADGTSLLPRGVVVLQVKLHTHFLTSINCMH